MVQEIVTEDTSVKSNHFKASEDNPKVRVKSEKSGKEVRLEALRWTAAVSCQQQSQSSLLSCQQESPKHVNNIQQSVSSATGGSWLWATVTQREDLAGQTFQFFVNSINVADRVLSQLSAQTLQTGSSGNVTDRVLSQLSAYRLMVATSSTSY
jgi:hypothetical protein